MVDLLQSAGKKVAVVEAELIGGECGYWACIVSKTLLRAPQAPTGAERTEGATRAELDWTALRAYRDTTIRPLDDSAQVQGYADQGGTAIKGTAHLTGPHTVAVNDRTLTAEHAVITSGSVPVIPAIDGLTDVGFWTNRDVTTLTEIPLRALLVGASAVGVEMSTFLSRFGTHVTLVQSADRSFDGVAQFPTCSEAYLQALRKLHPA